MSLRPKLQNVEKRRWTDIRGAWLASVPNFPSVGAPPEPGIEGLTGLNELSLPENKDTFGDCEGLRRNALWESVFLFHKCAHSHLAAQRLGSAGMHSWCMFNAYHSAYLGAKGLMGLLGVSIPELRGAQVLIDLFPSPQSKKDQKALDAGHWEFNTFRLVRLPHLDHRNVWECFQRVLNMSEVPCWDDNLCAELLELAHESIAKPRNKYLYRSAFWPGPDLVADTLDPDFLEFANAQLDVDDEGFLLRLAFSVYRLFDQLIGDLAKVSGPIRTQVEQSRITGAPEADELTCYNAFVAKLASADARP